MLLTKNIQIKTSNKNIGHYQKINPDIKSGDVIDIQPMNPKILNLKYPKVR